MFEVQLTSPFPTRKGHLDVDEVETRSLFALRYLQSQPGLEPVAKLHLVLAVLLLPKEHPLRDMSTVLPGLLGCRRSGDVEGQVRTLTTLITEELPAPSVTEKFMTEGFGLLDQCTNIFTTNQFMIMVCCHLVRCALTERDCDYHSERDRYLSVAEAVIRRLEAA